MKIDASSSSLVNSKTTRAPVANVAVKPQAPATDAPVTASVTASVTTHLAQSASLTTAEAPFNSQRVAEIRQAITEGRFEINADKIAGRLIGDVRDFLAKNQSMSG
ncbi:MAG: negative regulator of flagellin synthesis FlgM [Rugosibacter sp.]|nr:negative regulator of flagellin synthesis FlgM [Rugosibacter sp.]